jgi:hypothetical protein
MRQVLVVNIAPYARKLDVGGHKITVANHVTEDRRRSDGFYRSRLNGCSLPAFKFEPSRVSRALCGPKGCGHLPSRPIAGARLMATINEILFRMRVDNQASAGIADATAKLNQYATAADKAVQQTGAVDQAITRTGKSAQSFANANGGVTIASNKAIDKAVPLGRIGMTREHLRAFARSWHTTTTSLLRRPATAAVNEVLASYVGRVVIANPRQVRPIAEACVKTETIDATVLARLYASGFLPEVWVPDERTLALRRQITRRNQIVRQRTRLKTMLK